MLDISGALSLWPLPWARRFDPGGYGDTLPAPDREEARGDAIVALSTMVGAMTLARIVADGDLSSEILDRAKDHLHR